MDFGAAAGIDFTVDTSIVFESINHGAGDGLFGKKATCSAAGGSAGPSVLILVSLALAALAARRFR